jgi:poly-gamma-glutamate synthesis protein (capsule biosynthesis protein)
MFGFEPLPDYPLAPFHPEARNGMIGRLRFRADGRLEAGFIPLWFEPPGHPVPAGDRAAEVAAYIRAIGTRAGLPDLAFESDQAGGYAIA